MEIYKPGTMLGQYEVASLPMMGGMGVVYFCLDHGNNGKPVALKTFRPELLPDREARDRFLREGTAWVDLGSHPHIVRCHKVEYIDPTAFLVLELIAKEQGMEDASLRSWMGAPMKVEQALLFALQIARGLQHAANKIPGFVHRDLKPENVLVGADKLPGTNVNRLRMTDFGLATMLRNESDRVEKEDGKDELGRTHLTRGILGTPLYMAPEQWMGEALGVHTDVYALGCILYEMLTADRIVDGRSILDLRSAHCEGRLRSMPEDMPDEVSAWLEKCLYLHPAKRYQVWEDVTQGLEQVYADVARRATPAEMMTVQVKREEQMQEGWSYNAMGQAYLHIDKAEVAKGYFEKSLLIAREVGDRPGEGAALENLGNAYHQLGELRRAIGYHEQYLSIARQMGSQRGEAGALGNLGIAYEHLGKVREAIGYYEQGITIAHEVGDLRREGVILGNLGNAYHRLGEVLRAIEYCKRQLAISRETRDRRAEGDALTSLGSIYTALGEVRRAVEYYKQAIAVRREIADRLGEGYTLGNYGNVYLDLREERRAIKCFEQQLDIMREAGDRRGEGHALNNLGNAYYQLREVKRAIEYYELSLIIKSEVGDRSGEGYALGNLGLAYTDLGEMRRAMEYYELAIAIRHETGDSNGLALDLINMALLHSKQGESSRALPLAQEAERIFAQIGSPNVRAARQLIAELQGK